jgi:hypothetical protein
MDGLRWFFLESAAALGGTLAVLLFVLLVHWRRSGHGRPLLVGLGIAAILVLVQALVVTQREHADRILRRIEKDLVRGGISALAAALAPDFVTDDPQRSALRRAAFLDLAREWLRRVRVHWLERTDLRIESTGRDRFVVSAAYVTEIGAEQFGGVFRSRWSLTFVRTPAGWQILHLHPEQVENWHAPPWPALTPP